MGNFNYGSQSIQFRFEYLLNSDKFSELFNKTIKAGIYEGMELSKVDDSTVQVSSGVMVINDITGNNITVRIRTDNLSVITGISETTPVIVWRYQYQPSLNNYADLVVTDRYSVQKDDIVIGEAMYSSTTMDSEFDLAQRTKGFIQEVRDVNDSCKVTAVLNSAGDAYEDFAHVNKGYVSFGNEAFEVEDQNTPSFSVPTLDTRVDLLYINTSGVMTIEEGVEDGSLEPPSHNDRLVLAEITRYVGRTELLQRDIKDVRPWFFVPNVVLSQLEEQQALNDKFFNSGVLKNEGDELNLIPNDPENDFTLIVKTGKALVGGKYTPRSTDFSIGTSPASGVEVGATKDDDGYFNNLTGTLFVGDGSNTVTGTGTLFLTEIQPLLDAGKIVHLHFGTAASNDFSGDVVSVNSDTELTINRTVPGAETTEESGDALINDWETVDFSVEDEQILNCNGSVHKIKYDGYHKVLPLDADGNIEIRDIENNIVYSNYAYNKSGSGVDIRIDTADAKITRLNTGGVQAIVRINYSYGLPRFDLLELNDDNTLFIKEGTPDNYKDLIKPAIDANNIGLWYIFIDEMVSGIIEDDLLDIRFFIKEIKEGIYSAHFKYDSVTDITELNPKIIAELSNDTADKITGKWLPTTCTGDKYAPLESHNRLALCGVKTVNLLEDWNLVSNKHRLKDLFYAEFGYKYIRLEPDAIAGKEVLKLVYNPILGTDFEGSISLDSNGRLSSILEVGKTYCLSIYIKSNIEIQLFGDVDISYTESDSNFSNPFSSTEWKRVYMTFTVDSIDDPLGKIRVFTISNWEGNITYPDIEIKGIQLENITDNSWNVPGMYPTPFTIGQRWGDESSPNSLSILTDILPKDKFSLFFKQESMFDVDRILNFGGNYFTPLGYVLYSSLFSIEKIYIPPASVFLTAVDFIGRYGQTIAPSGDEDVFTNPYSIAFDSTGAYYVADYSDKLVKKFDSSGNYLFTIDFSLGSNILSKKIIIDNNDNLLIIYYSEWVGILLYDSDGNLIGKISDIPSGVTNEAIGFGYRTIIENSVGWDSSNLSDLMSIAISPLNNSLYICDYNNQKVKIFDKIIPNITGDITNIADGSTDILTHTCTGHGLSEGDSIIISGTSTDIDREHIVFNIIDTDNFQTKIDESLKPTLPLTGTYPFTQSNEYRFNKNIEGYSYFFPKSIIFKPTGEYFVGTIHAIYEFDSSDNMIGWYGYNGSEVRYFTASEGESSVNGGDNIIRIYIPKALELDDKYIYVTDSYGFKIFDLESWTLRYYDSSNSKKYNQDLVFKDDYLYGVNSIDKGIYKYEVHKNLNEGFYLKAQIGAKDKLINRPIFLQGKEYFYYVAFSKNKLEVSIKSELGITTESISIEPTQILATNFTELKIYSHIESIYDLLIFDKYKEYERDFIENLFYADSYITKNIKENEMIKPPLLGDYDFNESFVNRVTGVDDITFNGSKQYAYAGDKKGLVIKQNTQNEISTDYLSLKNWDFIGDITAEMYTYFDYLIGAEVSVFSSMGGESLELEYPVLGSAGASVGDHFMFSCWVRGREGMVIKLVQNSNFTAVDTEGFETEGIWTISPEWKQIYILGVVDTVNGSNVEFQPTIQIDSTEFRSNRYDRVEIAAPIFEKIVWAGGYSDSADVKCFYPSSFNLINHSSIMDFFTVPVPAFTSGGIFCMEFYAHTNIDFNQSFPESWAEWWIGGRGFAPNPNNSGFLLKFNYTGRLYQGDIFAFGKNSSNIDLKALRIKRGDIVKFIVGYDSQPDSGYSKVYVAIKDSYEWHYAELSIIKNDDHSGLNNNPGPAKVVLSEDPFMFNMALRSIKTINKYYNFNQIKKYLEDK